MRVLLILCVKVYLYNPASGDIILLKDFTEEATAPRDYICSVKWSAQSNHLAIGLKNGVTQPLRMWNRQKSQENSTAHSPEFLAMRGTAPFCLPVPTMLASPTTMSLQKMQQSTL